MAGMVFISHKESERSLAEALVNLLLAALDLQDDQIRCSSVPGFMLPHGKPISIQLKEDIAGSAVVYAILTTSSLQSRWVLFELGASWALGNVVIPILAPDLDQRALPGPLGSQTSIMISDDRAASRISDAIAQTAGLLGVAERTGGRPQNMLERFLDEFRRLPTRASEKPPPSSLIQDTATIQEGHTAVLAEGRLRITVNGIQGGPLAKERSVTASLNAPGHPTHRIKGTQPGEVLRYAGFDVYLMQVRPYEAIFDVESAVLGE